MKKALIVWGGWDGHEPKECSEVVAAALREDGFEVELSDTLDAFLDAGKMQALSVVIPVWTCGEINGDQLKGLTEAVKSGVGLAGWHGGMGDAFRPQCGYQFMVGGQFVDHPDGIKEYTVNIVKGDDPIVKGLSDFTVESEQYYMHVDPSNEVLATTTFDTQSAPWVNGCVMPVVWKRMYGQGRVFYSSLGHVAKDFDVPEVLEIQRRGTAWAAR